MCVHPHTDTHLATHATAYRISSMRFASVCLSVSVCVWVCVCMCVVAAIFFLYYMHTRRAPRDRALQKQLFFFCFKPTATIMAARKWQLLRRTIENELSTNERQTEATATSERVTIARDPNQRAWESKHSYSPSPRYKTLVLVSVWKLKCGKWAFCISM